VCVCIPPIVARQRLGNNPPTVPRQRLGRNVTAVTNTHATTEELLDASFSMCRIEDFLLDVVCRLRIRSRARRSGVVAATGL
jgi:hypothetical protein